jgi:deoxyadenosine/deoxycytidine kinase
MNSTIISIEGNIGSGKTTLLKNLKKHFENNSHVIFLKEPVDEWETIKDENDKTILEKFYADQKKYSFSFQMMAYISRLALLKETIEQNPNAIVITERSLYTDRSVFAKMLFDNGMIELIDYHIYLRWFDTFAKDYPIFGVIYVNTDPDICLERIEKRSRKGEKTIPLSYLENCHIYHEQMLDRNNSNCVCKNQLVIDGNADIHNNDKILQEWIQRIEKFILE